MSRELQAREVEQLSAELVHVGVKFVKRNPIKVSAYVLGLLICIFFNGFQISPAKYQEFQSQLNQIDSTGINQLHRELKLYERIYYQSKGWFSCNSECTINKRSYERALQLYKTAKDKEVALLAKAKNSVGIFSEYGVTEAKSMFWDRFLQGKDFATTRSKWDLLFLTIGAIGRDESIFEYAFRILMNLVSNFTIGLIGAVISFILSLYGLIRSYQPTILETITFFLLASLSALSFGITWLVLLYSAAAGTAYVGGRVLATTIRIQNGDTSRDQRRRLHREY